MHYPVDFYHHDFIKKIHLLLDEAIKKLHIAYERRNDFKFNIIDNIEYYKKAGVKIDIVLDENNTNKIYVSKSQESRLGTKLMNYIRSYNYLIYTKIPKLQSDIEAYASVREAPHTFYTYFRNAINVEINKIIAKGLNQSFGANVGYVYVHYHKIMPGQVFKYIDWFATNKLKKRLLEQNIVVKSKDNPEGVPFLVYKTKDFYITARYRRVANCVDNAKFYKFKFLFNNGFKKPCLVMTPDGEVVQDVMLRDYRPFRFANVPINEIINNRRLPLFNKILAICVNYPKEAEKMYHNNLKELNTNL